MPSPRPGPNSWRSPNSNFLSIGKIIAGTGGSQIATFIALPIIARIYGPANFGVFGVIVTLAAVLSTLMGLTLHYAISHAHGAKRARELFIVAVLVSLASGCIITLGAASFLIISGNHMVALQGLALAACVALAGIGLATQSLAAKHGRFGAVGTSAAIKGIGIVSAQIGFGIFGAKAWGLIFGQIIGEMFASLYLMAVCRSFFLGHKSVKLSVPWLAALLRRNRDFTVFGTLQEAVNLVSQFAPIWVLSAMFGSSIAGAYTLAYRLVQAPVSLLTNGVRQVLAPQMQASARKPVEMYQQFATYTRLALIVSSISLLVVVIPVEDIVAVFLGSEWIPAASYIAWLTPWAAMLIANVPATIALRTLRKQQFALFFVLLLLMLRVGVLVAFGLIFDARIAVIGFCIAGIVWNAAYIYQARRFLQINLNRQLAPNA